MADDPLSPAEVDVRREMALLRGTQAPVVYFEAVTTQGIFASVGNMTVEGGIHVLLDGKIATESRVMAHLRFPMEAIPGIRAALDYIERAQSKPIPNELKN